MPAGFNQDPPFTSSKGLGQSQSAIQVFVFVIYLCTDILFLSCAVSETERMNTNVCVCVCVFSSLEPVNRANAAREFRVFHAALHSLNSAYRDSVSRRHTEVLCSTFGVDLLSRGTRLVFHTLLL